MGILALKADERVSGVKFTKDALSVSLRDGRTITVPLAWYPRLLSASAATQAPGPSTRRHEPARLLHTVPPQFVCGSWAWIVQEAKEPLRIPYEAVSCPSLALQACKRLRTG